MNELSIIQQAILNEVEGTAFYEMAVLQATNTDVKLALQHLRDQEIVHERWLRSLNQSIQAKITFKLDQDKLNELEKVQSPGIFAKAGEVFQFSAIELAIFGAGLLMEKASIDFYDKAAKEAVTPEEKELFNHLVKWETVHLELLDKIHSMLQDEWWEKQQFSPA
ncbi:MAG: ferritin family protein [Desulfitobacteriaceae bacterium]